ncbi:glycoside hydrolase family 172 protein [Leptospira sp. GIMC2001]|uniref:glycoside hydrolase family 172 protein n=1 Tax=Leptospira sp. GIMC2001 TaxID=1513297 RepID=UPI00234BC1D7|nr:glycoside hydrolase family 172 protein [Leptospira sp. GIMC2001]WCL49366.1 DUF2961 domain-containing protein [Leptospira sp. GIMC2001]
MIWKFIIYTFIILFQIQGIYADSLSELWQKRQNYDNYRVSSFDKSGGNDDFVKIIPNGIYELADLKGSGIIRHIWITLWSKDKMILRNAVLRIHWDGQKHPSVEVPLGDFFGQGWGEEYIMNSLPIVAAPKKGKGLNSYFSMPYSDGAKITVENQSSEEIGSFYFYVDYEKRNDITKDSPRFHANWRRSTTKPETNDDRENDRAVLGPMHKGKKSLAGNFVFADIEGDGHFVGIQYYVDSPTPLWYGEGDDMIFIDGTSWPPRLHGTGTEDFFNTAWCPKEVFHHPYFGYPRVTESIGWLGRTHIYRFFLESPIRFSKSFVGSIEHGHGNSLSLDLAAVAYWYQTLPNKKFPELPSVQNRQNKPAITENDIHRWRDSYRKSKGGGEIWGNQ